MTEAFGSELTPEYPAFREACDTLDDRAFVAWFLKQCNRTSTGCLVWRGQKHPAVRRGGERIQISVLVLKVGGQIVGEGQCARRSCGNPRCVNPEHLLVSDAMKKITIGQAWEIVRKLDAGGCFKADIAREYGISITAVNKQRERVRKYFEKYGQKA